MKLYGYFKKRSQSGQSQKGEGKVWSHMAIFTCFIHFVHLCGIFILNILYSLKKYYLKNPQVAIRWERRLILGTPYTSTVCGKFNLLEHLLWKDTPTHAQTDLIKEKLFGSRNSMSMFLFLLCHNIFRNLSL